MITAMATTRRADMFTADGTPSDDDPRENGPGLGDERTTLVEALRCQRLTLELKCAGLDAESLARRSVEPSTMSLLGLVRHLPEMERATFRVMMAGQRSPEPTRQRRGPMSLREAMVGMIEEYARPMGHADLLRERIDGRLGQ
jgi:hypothetical protein